MSYIEDTFHIINKDGQFDARKARQALREWSRENSVVNKSLALAEHLGLSGEDTYLLVAMYLLGANEGLLARLMEEVNLRVPTFQVQATKDGPFVPIKPWVKL